MKNVLLVLCTMFAIATTSFAQNTPADQAPAEAKAKVKGHGKDMNAKGKEKAHKEAGKTKEAGAQGKGMGANLGLSSEQQTQYATVNKAHQEAVRKVQMDAALTPEAKKSQIAALKSKYETDVKGVMNADQYAKWSEGRAKRAENKATGKMNDHKEGEHKMEGKKGEHKMEGKKGKAKTDQSLPQGASKSN